MHLASRSSSCFFRIPGNCRIGKGVHSNFEFFSFVSERAALSDGVPWCDLFVFAVLWTGSGDRDKNMYRGKLSVLDCDCHGVSSGTRMKTGDMGDDGGSVLLL